MEAVSNNHITLIQNKIQSTIIETYNQTWTVEAGVECYEKEIEKLDFKIEYLTNDIVRIEEDIKEITPQIDLMEEQYKIIMDSYFISQESLLIQKSHIECISEKAKTREEEEENILRKYKQHLETRTKELQEKSPIFQKLRQLQIQLKKEKFDVNILKTKRKIQLSGDKLRHKKHQQRYYQVFIAFAKAWLGKKKYDESIKKLKELSAKEKELRIKMVNLSKDYKEKQKVDQRKEVCVPHISSDLLNDAVEKLKEIAETPLIPKNDDGVSKNPLSDLNSIFVKPNYTSYLPLIKQTQNLTKVNVLENKIIKSANGETKFLSNTMSKEERSKALSKKLQVLQNMRKRTSSFKEKKLKPHSSIKHSIKPSNDKTEENGNNDAGNKLIPSVKIGGVQDVNRHIKLSQELESKMLSSQDYQVMNMLSQESGKSIQTKLEEFRYEPDLVQPRLNTSPDKRFTNCNENFQGTTENAFNKTEQPQYFSVKGTDGGNYRTTDLKLGHNLERYQPFMTNNNRSEYFSRNNINESNNDQFGKTAPSSQQALPQGPFKSPVKKKSLIFDNKFGTQIDKTIENPPNINNNTLFNTNFNPGNRMEGDNNKFHVPFSMIQPGMNNNMNNNIPHKKQKLEDVADHSLVNISLDKNYAAEFSQQASDENKMLDINESQYNFGNITGFMPSPMSNFPMSPDFSNPILQEHNQNESVMPFGQQGFAFSQMNTNFGFNF